MKYIKWEDFHDEIAQEAYDQVYHELVEKAIALAKEIMQLKQLDFPNTEEEDILFTIEYTFQKEFGQFREMIYFMRNLSLWNYVNDLFDDPKEQKLKTLVRQYNALLKELRQYHEVQKELQAKDYTVLVEERLKKLRQLFMDMLDYKNKTYAKDADFDTLLPLVSRYYNIYSESLYNAQSAISCHMVSFDIEEDSVMVNDVEAIMFLDDLYFSLTCPGDDYKEYAHFYRDFDLEEGQTYEDLYRKEEAKFLQLFREMLDFIGVKYDLQEENVDRMRLLVIEHYPYYSNSLLSFHVHNPNDTYIQILDHLEDIYENISTHYQNHQENMRRYQEQKQKEVPIEEDDFFE